MAGFWREVFETEIGGRPITGEMYSEGGYKISTTQKSDYEGSISGDKSGMIVMPPIAAGQPIEIDAETLEELGKELMADGEFSQSESDEIVGKFRT